MIPGLILLILLAAILTDYRRQQGLLKPRLELFIDISPATPAHLAYQKAYDMMEYVPSRLHVRITLFAQDIITITPYEYPQQARLTLAAWLKNPPKQAELPRIGGPNFACLINPIKRESRRLLLPPPHLLVLTDNSEECAQVFKSHKLPLKPQSIPNTIAEVEAKVG